MSDFPANRHEMLRANYHRTGASVCNGCGAAIEWWKTNNNKSIPMNPIAGDYTPAEPHWATCPNAKDFKGAAAAPGETPVQPAPRRYSLERELAMLRDRTDARVVVVVGQDGTVASWDKRIPGEDLRHDLISAANFVRNQIAKQEVTPA